MSRKKKLLIGGGVVLLLGGMTVVALKSQRRGGIEVQVETVKRRDLTAMVSASGKIQPKQSVDISAEVVGRVVRIGVKEGDAVQAGDFLLQIDPTTFTATLSQAEASLRAAKAQLTLAEANVKQAQQTLQRKQELFQNKLISSEELELARTDFQVRRAELDRARQLVAESEARVVSARHDVRRVTFTAPMSGLITRLNVEEGETVVMGTMNQPGTVLLTIADLSVMEAEVEVDETDIIDVKVGQEAKVTVDAFPDTVLTGVVTEVGNSPIISGTDPSRQVINFKVVATLKESLPRLRPGLSATADIVTATREKVLAIPIQSLVLRELPKDTTGVNPDNQNEEDEELTNVDQPQDRRKRKEREKEGAFVVVDGKARFRPVETGVASERFFEILKGLEESAQVITGPYKALRDLKDGSIVKVKRSKEKKTKA